MDPTPLSLPPAPPVAQGMRATRSTGSPFPHLTRAYTEVAETIRQRRLLERTYGFYAWVGVALFTAEPEARVEELPQIALKALPSRTEQWLESQRPALPAPANRLLDQIGVRLEGLAPCVQGLSETEPAAREVRRLVGEELPELIRGYQRVPQQLRRQGPDAQLVEGLRVVEGEIARMTEQLASGDLDKLATQGKYLELKYRGVED